jgi:hypothetical protein
VDPRRDRRRLLRAVRGSTPKKLESAALILSGLPFDDAEEERPEDPSARVDARDWESGHRESSDEIAILEVEVWSCNLTAVETWERCQPSIVGGMGTMWQGVSALEVEAACRLGRVPKRERTDVVDDVQFMARVVAARHNRNAQREAERARRK